MNEIYNTNSWIPAELDSIINKLEKMISMDTTIGSQNELPLALYMQKELEQCSIKTHVFESAHSRGNLYAEIPGKSKDKILLHAHMDTAEFMKGASNQVRIRNRKVFGRGALDCKGLAAVFMQIMIDISEMGIPEKTLAFTAVADEETDGTHGTKWLMEHTDCFDSVKLVLGEGGGYPVPGENYIFYTFQTGEIEKEKCDLSLFNTTEKQNRILYQAERDGYYTHTSVEYFENKANFTSKRCVDRASFYEGVLEFLNIYKRSPIAPYYFQLFETILQELNPTAKLLPVITPGYSDNRFFRKKGIPVIGFFPLHQDNSIGGIHGEYEYISFESLMLSYKYYLKVIPNLLS